MCAVRASRLCNKSVLACTCKDGPSCTNGLTRRQQIAVDVFAFPSQHMDLASLGTLCKYTCGQLYYYPQFNAAQDAPKLRHELHHNLTRTTGAH